MKHIIKSVILCAGMAPALANAQAVDRTKYPDYQPTFNPDYSLLEHGKHHDKMQAKGVEEKLPDHVDNSRYKYFPPVFNQDGGSCGSASRICYMFTHELNAYRDADAKLLSNRYPSHFVWLLTYSPSGKEHFAINVGVPSAEVYGGITYSALFGNQQADQPDYGWMQGYDKWYSGMFNRMSAKANFPISVGSKEGRDAVKRWIYNHNGDYDFHAGGIVGIGVASGGDWQPIPSTPANDELGVSGKYFVNKWGTQVDHALTVVGYDDRIEFDLNGNGIAGEVNANEKGAWIVVNSWSDGWCNNGFIYCPYAYAGTAFKPDGSFNGDFWCPEIYKVRKNYRPLRTIKVKMDYSRRSEICLSAGVSADLNATAPEQTEIFHHFIYAGDGKNGTLNPAPEVPMLGRWADGKLHYEPMEFGYDLTDLSANFDKNAPLKYFFIIETRSFAEGVGKVYNASIIDYEFDKMGIETPFPIDGEGVKIENKGNKTIISTIVYGETYYAPQNLVLQGNKLAWNAPLKSVHQVKGYRIYQDGTLLAETAGNVMNYDLGEIDNATFSVTAVYEDGTESSKINVSTPVISPNINKITNFKHSGFSIPNIFKSKYDEMTLEFWIKPTSLRDWNQSAGPGWGTFMMHANSNGALTVGWDTQNRTQTQAGALKTGVWSHVAITVDKNIMRIYINGIEKGAVTSSQYSGIGGFGDLRFNPDGNNSADARFDEIRIWNFAKDKMDIQVNKDVEFKGELMPKGLIAYYKGDILEKDGHAMLHENIAANHAMILNDSYQETIDTRRRYNNSEEQPNVQIVEPGGSILMGIPTTFEAQYSYSVNRLLWTAEGAGVKELPTAAPCLTFNKTGDQMVIAHGYSPEGEEVADTLIVNVKATPAPNAKFTCSKKSISAGERVSFLAEKPQTGYLYTWHMPGAEVETAHQPNTSNSYSLKGNYKVTLTVKAPDGTESSSSQDISVVEVAPKADFDISPAVIVKGETTYFKDKSKLGPNRWQWLLHSENNNIVINGQNTSFSPVHTGIYDVTLNVANGSGMDKKTQERALIVCNADSKNGLSFNNANAQVQLSQMPLEKGENNFTIEWWMKPNTLLNYCNGMGNDDNFCFKTTALGSILFQMNGDKVESHENFVIANEWHHYAITFSRGNLRFYRDGKYISGKGGLRSAIPEVNTFLIGTGNAPFNGQIDEFRIWKKTLSLKEIKEVANEPIADVTQASQDNGLVVYYNFNQSNGNVKDLTSNQNEGIRIHFGPEGDAWGLSRGVFCLNFENTAQPEEITGQYFSNYKAPFLTNGDQLVNPSQRPRFKAITDWTLENAQNDGSVTTSVHVDRSKDYCFTFTAGWDNFGIMQDHKAYQTFTLPAGSYEFTAYYGNYEGNCGNTYLAAAQGKSLPNTMDISKAIAAVKMVSKSNTTNSNTLQFVLTKETEISLGLIINMSGKQCCTINRFELTRTDIEVIDADNANGFDLTVGANGYTTLCLPYPTIVPKDVTVYTAEEVVGDQVIVAPIEDGIVPAHTGVIVAATAGEYHFAPSQLSSDRKSILFGYLKESTTEDNKRYYEFSDQNEPSFVLLQGKTLHPNQAYLVREAGDTHEVYNIALDPVGIEGLENAKSKQNIYDLGGRHVGQPTKGIYISNGKKVIIK